MIRVGLGWAGPTTNMSWTVSIPYDEFRNYIVEGDGGPWGDRYFHECFDKYVEDDLIEIEYKYGNYVNGKSEITWRLSCKEGKVRKVRYGGSSRFALWWCGLTDELEDSIPLSLQ